MSSPRPSELANGESFRRRFLDLHPLIAAEAEGLTPQQLDFASDKWAWSRWSIRKQFGHMASVHFSWLFDRWGADVFKGQVPAWYKAAQAMPPADRWQYFARGGVPDILEWLRAAITTSLGVVARETPQSMRGRQLTVTVNPGWIKMVCAHPTGVVQDKQDPAKYHMTLEGTLRHVYWENITHLYNVQRLKKAQGLPARARIPFEGYHALDGWDRTEP